MKQIAWCWNLSDAIAYAYEAKSRWVEAMVSVGKFGYAVMEGNKYKVLPLPR